MKNDIQVTVFGATGQVGRRIVTLLLAHGVRVVAAVHGDNILPAHDRLTILAVDIYDADSVARALKGSTAVISALGSWGTKRQDVLTVGMKHIVAGMQAQSMMRLISLTGAEARATGDQLGLIHRLMHTALLVVASKILRDGEYHIGLLEVSELDWTVIRSPIMSNTDSVSAGVLSKSRPLPWQRISRQAVSMAMVQLLDDDGWNKQAPYIR